ncbi:MAG: SDR family NAD(P)-dependent oxidoreductase [Anaerolineaceae bacterium]|nr:SDR family NAD(P)-dependent oxidoreductase [Anaerolineaceae bacterium]
MSEKVIVITGASGGIGAATAKILANRGDKVVLAARRLAELKQVAAECGAGALTVVTDVTRRADMEHLRDEAMRAFGRVDVWLNNAGRGITRQVLDLTDDDIDQILAVNLRSALYGMQVIVPYFKEQGAGHLINVSSALGRVPFASQRSIYSASKAALNSLTANLRMDLRKAYPNIHVSVVMPPMVSTDFAKNALHGTPPPPPGFSSASGAAQTPEQTAAAIVDLIDHPRPEIYTNPDFSDLVARYYSDVAAFEENMGR